MRNKKAGAAYIDVILAVFLCLVVLAVSLGVFQTMYDYQKLNDIAQNTLEYASIKGQVANKNEVQKKIESLIISNGYDLDEVTYSFNSSELLLENGDYSDKVQYGENISLYLKTNCSIGFLNSEGAINIPIEISRTVTSQKYWK